MKKLLIALFCAAVVMGMVGQVWGYNTLNAVRIPAGATQSNPGFISSWVSSGSMPVFLGCDRGTDGLYFEVTSAASPSAYSIIVKAKKAVGVERVVWYLLP